MSRDPRACAGPCNARYRKAWDAHDAAYARWAAEVELLEAARAQTSVPGAQITPEPRSESDEGHEVDPGGAEPQNGSQSRECCRCRDARFLIVRDAAGNPDAGEWAITYATPRDCDHALAPDAPLPLAPAEPDIEPRRKGDPHWCGPCTGHVRGALHEIGDLAAILDSWADGHRGANSGEKVGRGGGSAPASPSPIGDVLDELYGDLTAIEDGWRQFRGYSPRPRRARNGHARALSLAFLIEHLADIACWRDATPALVRILDWQRRLQAMSRTDPVVRRRPGRCPRCGLVSTLQTRDDGYTECRECGRLMTEDEYVDEVETQVHEGVRA